MRERLAGRSWRGAGLFRGTHGRPHLSYEVEALGAAELNKLLAE